MKYVVDEIIEKIAILESLEDKTKKEVELSLLPATIKEGSIVKEELTYKEEIELESKRRKILREKLERLKKLEK